MKLINIGFGNLVSAERVLAIVSPDSAPIKRLIQESRERGMLIDATYGRKTASVFVMDSDHVVLSAIAAEKLAQRLGLEILGGLEENELKQGRPLSSPAPPASARAPCSVSCCGTATTSIFRSPPQRARRVRVRSTAFTIISSMSINSVK